MNKNELKRMIFQTLLRGKLVEIKDSPDKSHILGLGHCENFDLINKYIDQLDYNNIISMFQENEYSDLFIETKNKLEVEYYV